MEICDLHVHSQFSFDSDAPIDAIQQAASIRGVSVVALTDHCDMTAGPEGIQYYIAHEEARLQAFRAAPQTADLPELLYGVEIGNAIDMPEETNVFLSQRKFDFVLGAIHFLPNGEDIYKLPYPDAESVDRMFLQYFSSLKSLVALGNFDALAHLDYPLRVLRGKLMKCSILIYRDYVDSLLRELVRKDIALEVNTRGTYDWQGRVGPEDWALRRYRELGGRLVTIGSDAHKEKDVGEGFLRAVESLRRTGFQEYAIYRSRVPCPVGL